MVNEKLLWVSPSLAQQLGLEEALLYQFLIELVCLQGSSVQLTANQCQRLLPFWNLAQFKVILHSLVRQQKIEVQGEDPWHIQCSNTDEQSLTSSLDRSSRSQSSLKRLPVVGMNQARQHNQVDDQLAYLNIGNRPKEARTCMQADWQPSEQFAKQLEFHQIPMAFALAELDRFRSYYQQKNRAEYSWDHRFLNWVQRAWHDQRNQQGRYERNQQTDGREPSAREKRLRVREALQDIHNTDW